MLLNALYLRSAQAFRPCLRSPHSIRFVPNIPRRGLFSTARFLSDKSQPSIFPSFRDHVAQTKEVESFGENVKRPPIRNQVIVCANFLIFGLIAFDSCVLVRCRPGSRCFLVCCSKNEHRYRALVEKDFRHVDSLVDSSAF
jgi:hypothetical protein